MSTPAADTLISLRGVGKSYPQIFRTKDRLRALARLIRGQAPQHAAEVISGIDLEVKRGESLGLIGINGAGKSTLLKLITGVLTPTTGSVKVYGRIAPLLELGAGFHPEYSGRDNVRLNATLLGMSPALIDQRLDSIIAFADIGRYIDEPVKHYSSGMIVRLGFAVVAATEPDLLITDEVLAVGDESFQKKCVQWIEAFLAKGGTLLLVSHSMYHIQKLCRHACWLQHGRIERIGDVFEVTQDYLAWHERQSQDAVDGSRVRAAAGEYALLDFLVNDDDGQTPVLLRPGEPLRVQVTIRARDQRQPVLAIGLKRVDGTPVYGTTSEIEAAVPRRVDADHYLWQLAFDAPALLPGSYLLEAHALDPEGVRLFDSLERGLVVRGESREFGMVRLPHRWGG